MKLTKKKELLKKIALEGRFTYSPCVYQIINSGILDKTIIKIDNQEVVCNVNPSDITSADEQFVQLLNRFVYYFQKSYYKMFELDYLTIKEIIEDNYVEVENFLLSKHYLGDNNYISFFNDSIYRVFIKNFIKNIKYIDILTSFLESENLKVKKINNYSLKEIIKINGLLADIVFCSNNMMAQILLFQNIDNTINKKLNDMKQKNASKQQLENCVKGTVNFFNMQYEIMIREYLAKKELLKYFKNAS